MIKQVDCDHTVIQQVIAVANVNDNVSPCQIKRSQAILKYPQGAVQFHLMRAEEYLNQAR